MYYTYILLSKNYRRTYTGHTSDLTKRLAAHNSGEVKSTKRFRPYEILLVEEFHNLEEAKIRELYYKDYRGRQRIKRLIEERNPS